MILKGGVVGGLRAVFRSWGLLGLLLSVNLAVASLLAIPLWGVLRHDLSHRDAASSMMYGFDHAWWSRWSEGQTGATASFGPEILGIGFVLRNWDLVLKGEVPARIFPKPDSPSEGEGQLESAIAGLGLAYLLVQTFLAGGILSIFRAPQGSWTVRGLLHGSGFYFGRFFRLALLVLLVDYGLFALNVPAAHFAASRAREAVSEVAAIAWVFGRQACFVLALLFVHMVSCYAKVITVLEERTSAILAFVSSFAFCLARLVRTTGHYALIASMGVVLLGLWAFVDGEISVTGYKTQVVAFLLGQALIVSRLVLRLGLLGGQMEIYRQSTSPLR
ncbi:MAG TPA: hypothetical protein VN083_02350 [Vicinamibacteria bacterium]|jgi:hypothetical protein|nr:hypothetical protein [Vicinamibacteria bacterium]